jgi:nucleoside diphosphate kinase
LKKSLRHEFDEEKSQVNSLHGATNEDQVDREIKFFNLFPETEQTVAIIKPNLSKEKKGNIKSKNH